MTIAAAMLLLAAGSASNDRPCEPHLDFVIARERARGLEIYDRWDWR